MKWPVSVKGVVFDEDDRVLLGRNDRGEWELLGGRLEIGESPEEAVRRELREESGLAVEPRELLRAWVFAPMPNARVLIVTYGCTAEPGALEASVEHSRVAFHDVSALERLSLPEGYRTDIRRWRTSPARLRR